jgi:signal peptidase
VKRVDKSFWTGLAKDVAFAAIVVVVIASLAYFLAGTWPVMVAVESGSMMPHMYRGDVVFIQGADRTDIITHQVGREINYTLFGDYGDVIVYRPDGNPDVMPIIHRAMYWVDVGEAMPGGVVAPHSGYITKGDHNSGYDQPRLSGPVKPEWVVGVARARIPYIGYFRLAFGSDVTHIIGSVRQASY